MFDPRQLSPDDRRHFYRRTALAAIGLGLVAGLHAWRVVAYDQTPWKGGGFGMFSTVDAETARFLQVFLITNDGEAFPVRAPDSLAKRAAVLRAAPTAELAKEIAERMADLRYYRDESQWQESLADHPVPPIADAADLPRPTSTIDPSPAILGRISDWTPVPANAIAAAGFRPAAVRVEVWRHVYDSEKHQLIAERILQATVQAAKPADTSSVGGSDE